MGGAALLDMLALRGVDDDGVVAAAVAWTCSAKRARRGWGTGIRRVVDALRHLGLPTTVPPSRLEGAKRLCAVVRFLGETCGLRVPTVRGYIGSYYQALRLVDPSLTPAPKQGLVELALSRYADDDRRMKRQYELVDLDLLRVVIEDCDPPPVVKAALLFGRAMLCRTGEFVRSEGGVDWDRNLVLFGDVVLTATDITVDFYTRKNNAAALGAKKTQTCGARRRGLRALRRPRHARVPRLAARSGCDAQGGRAALPLRRRQAAVRGGPRANAARRRGAPRPPDGAALDLRPPHRRRDAPQALRRR